MGIKGGFMKALPADERAEVRTVSFCKRFFLKIYNHLKEKNSVYTTYNEVTSLARAFLFEQFSNGANPRDCEIRRYVLGILSQKPVNFRSTSVNSRYLITRDRKVPKRGGKY